MANNWGNVLQHAAAGGSAWWIFSALIQTMPAPLPMERWYGWTYSFLQRVGANFALANKEPAPMVRLSSDTKPPQ